MPKLFRYKVLCGTHVVGETAYGPTSEAGGVFETSQDLSKHNVAGQQPRFELLEAKPVVEKSVEVASSTSTTDSSVPMEQTKQDDGLDAMTTAELKTFASDANIDVLGVNRKDDLVKVIRRAVANS